MEIQVKITFISTFLLFLIFNHDIITLILPASQLQTQKNDDVTN